MKVIKFRQPLFKPDGEFLRWHYWGHIEDGFVPPVAADLGKNSQQYTGLNEKIGKKQEIYESDTVQFEYNGHIKAAVIFKNGTFCIKLEEGSYPLCEYIHQNLKIIGNIDENPELLEEK